LTKDHQRYTVWAAINNRNKDFMKHLKRQDGIAQLLIVALVAIVLVVIGLAIWQSQHVKTKADQATNSPTPSAAAQASSTPAPTVANEIKVTELGFKMSLPVGLTDLKYVATTNQTGTANGVSYQYSTASFSTTALEQKASGIAACTAAEGPIGRITRYSVDPSTFGTTNSVTKKVGSFYLGFTMPQSPCSSASADSQLQTSDTSLLRQAFDNAAAL
jgi:hypothetical protein